MNTEFLFEYKVVNTGELRSQSHWLRELNDLGKHGWHVKLVLHDGAALLLERILDAPHNAQQPHSA